MLSQATGSACKGTAGRSASGLRPLLFTKHARTCTHRSWSTSVSAGRSVDVLETTYQGTLPRVQFGEDGVVPFVAARPAPRVSAPEGARPLVILPGFGNNAQDYEAPFGEAEGSLANNLRARGFSVFTVDLERKDWFRVARGLLTFGFWSSSLTTDPGYTWYLDRVADTVARALQETGADQVDLVCHSAGGWLGRAFLADPKYRARFAQATPSPSPSSSSIPGEDGEDEQTVTTAALPSLPPLLLTLPQPLARLGAGSKKAQAGVEGGDGEDLVPNPAVRAIVTLGSPQRPPPPEEMKDMTGGALGWLHSTYPGAFFADAGVAYVNVCGITVRGERQMGDDGKPVKVEGRPRMACEYAYDSYQQVCGKGQGVEGDAVVPLSSAFLAGARQLVLPGVWHSVSKIGTFDEASGVVWYGSAEVVDSWLGPYVQEAYKGTASSTSGTSAVTAVGSSVMAWIKGWGQQ